MLRDPVLTTLKTFKCEKCKEVFKWETELKWHRCRALGPRPRREGEDEDGWLKLKRGPPNKPPAQWDIYSDGSSNSTAHSGQQRPGGPPPEAGFGVAVYRDADRATPEYRLYGPVVTDKNSHLFFGAEGLSNNTGELSEIAEALLWVRDEAPDAGDTPVTIFYDSEYAAELTQQLMNPKKNKALVQTSVDIAGAVASMRKLEFTHVKGHSDDPGNDEADTLADVGAGGRSSNQSKRWCAPQPWNTDKEAWEREECRKCGEDYGSDARRCGIHESKCKAGPVPNPGFMKCRKCGELVGSGKVPEVKSLREIRTAHEKACRGSAQLNATCKVCGAVSPAGGHFLNISSPLQCSKHERGCEKAGRKKTPFSISTASSSTQAT